LKRDLFDKRRGFAAQRGKKNIRGELSVKNRHTILPAREKKKRRRSYGGQPVSISEKESYWGDEPLEDSKLLETRCSLAEILLGAFASDPEDHTEEKEEGEKTGG